MHLGLQSRRAVSAIAIFAGVACFFSCSHAFLSSSSVVRGIGSQALPRQSRSPRTAVLGRYLSSHSTCMQSIGPSGADTGLDSLVSRRAGECPQLHAAGLLLFYIPCTDGFPLLADEDVTSQPCSWRRCWQTPCPALRRRARINSRRIRSLLWVQQAESDSSCAANCSLAATRCVAQPLNPQPETRNLKRETLNPTRCVAFPERRKRPRRRWLVRISSGSEGT